jgi:20S proteasome alpha/beta subunit
MTTIIGINAAGYGTKGIILASDLAGTRSDWSPQGDVAIRLQRKSEVQKIYVDDRKEIAVASSGVHDQLYTNFLLEILDRKIDLKSAIEKGSLQEFLDMHLKRWGGRNPDLDYTNGLLFVTRFGEPRLFSCYPMGKIEEIDSWIPIGSGSRYARDYILGQQVLIPGRCSLERGIDLAVGSLQSASEDIYTSGLDIVVATNDNIVQFGEDIRIAIEDARKNAIEGIKSIYRPNANGQ